jgi:prepilin-type N-terminal cleavage/methylation domain-containing protein
VRGFTPALRARGFTLVEALVALLILAIVAVLAYRGTASLTDGEARLVGFVGNAAAP